ncbi:hypothetical protein RCL_jg3246.t1 [Rhizophagus clarus]|uniref:Uncharacterized protein n=1 Tax=Rhizophagus clarus TaxID=94130 RepID=A0A8H3M932_9GLOM|nr:hypothetical protein RCL_jg3246.t1 [Rhizophagus clarus]
MTEDVGANKKEEFNPLVGANKEEGFDPLVGANKKEGFDPLVGSNKKGGFDPLNNICSSHKTIQLSIFVMFKRKMKVMSSDCEINHLWRKRKNKTIKDTEKKYDNHFAITS